MTTTNNQIIGSEQESEKFKTAVAQALREEFAVTAWKPQEKVRMMITCPSGQRCLLKHLTQMDLLEADLIEEIDFFTKNLFPTEGKKDDDDLEDVWSLLRDPEKRCRFFQLLNRLMVVGVVRPQIVDDGVAVVTDSQGRKVCKLGMKKLTLKEGQVPASLIDFADRMAIFSELNKPLSEITPFRKEQVISLASLEPSKGITGTPE